MSRVYRCCSISLVRKTLNNHLATRFNSSSLEHGNTTVYEWRYGEPPLRIEEPTLLLETEAPSSSSDEAVNRSFHIARTLLTCCLLLQIDFGDAAVDFGIGDVELETGDIDWGQIDMLPDAHEATIDFSTTEDAELGIVVQEAGLEGGVAKDNEALTMLDYHKTRNMFVDDLAEVVICSRMNMELF